MFFCPGTRPRELHLGTVEVHTGKRLRLLVSFGLSALSRPHVCPRRLSQICFLVMKPWGSFRDDGLTCIHPCPSVLRDSMPGTGSDDLGEEFQRGLVDGRRLLRENNQSSVANSQSNYRDYTATAQTHILGKIGWHYTKYNFLLEWMVVEKHVLLCHSIIW